MTSSVRRPAAVRSRGVLMAAGVLLALTGCESDSVEIDSPDVDAATEATCRALLDDVPDVLADELRRPVTPDDALGAAWGEPAVTLVCGVGKPSDQDMFATCQVVDDVGWWAPTDRLTEDRLDLTLTTVGTDPLVQVTLPASSRPQAMAPVMAELAPVLRKHLETVKPCR